MKIELYSFLNPEKHSISYLFFLCSATADCSWAAKHKYKWSSLCALWTLNGGCDAKYECCTEVAMRSMNVTRRLRCEVWTTNGGCDAKCERQTEVAMRSVNDKRRLRCEVWMLHGGCDAKCERQTEVAMRSVNNKRRSRCVLWTIITSVYTIIY